MATVTEVTPTQWADDVQRFIALMDHESASLWAQAEHAREMKVRYGRETARNLSTEVGCSQGYIRELIGTANVFPDPAERAQDLSFSHHRIAAFTDEPDRWLGMAVAQQWSVQDLREAGQAAGRTRTYLGAVYHRLAGRRGKQRAAVATGRHILVAAYHILRAPDTVYQDLGADYFDQRDRAAVLRRHTRRLEALGYRVTVEPLAPAAG